MSMNSVNISINKKKYNNKTISDKTWKENEKNNTQLSTKEMLQSLVEEIDLDNDVNDNYNDSVVDFSNDDDESILSKVGATISEGACAVWNKVSDFASDVGDAISDGFDTVSDLATGAVNTISEWKSEAFEWVLNREKDIKKFATDSNGVLLKTTEKINEILGTTGATLGTVAFGLVEGVGKFGEALVDTATILGTGVASIVTGLVDLGTYIASGKSKGLTGNIWENTMSFVSEEWVSGAFDKLYDDTKIGKTIKENALGFNTTRGISSGIGYVAGLITLTVATCGAGTAPTIAETISSTATTGSILSGAAGIGQGAEEAWSSGASLGEGLLYAGTRGVYEGLSYYAGGKVSGVVIGEGATLTSKLLTSAFRVGADALDGGASGFIDPLAKMIYNDKSYKDSFEENGGLATVATNAVIGGGMSTIGEVADNVKIYHHGKQTFSEVSKIEVPEQQFFPIYKSIKRIDNADFTTTIDNLKFSSETSEGLKRLIDFYNGLKTKYQYDTRVSKKLFELGDKDLTITDIDFDNLKNSHQNANYIVLDEKTLSNECYSTFFHETGHFSDWYSNSFTTGMTELAKVRNNYGNITNADVEKLVRDGIKIKQSIFDYLNDASSGGLEVEKLAIEKYYKIQDLNLYSEEQQYTIWEQIHKETFRERQDYYYIKSGMVAIEDIMDSMTSGEFFNKYDYVYGHGVEYYKGRDIYLSTEIIANFSDLYYNNKTDLLEKYFSKEFKEQLENAHKKIVGLDSFKFDYTNQQNQKLLSIIDNAQKNKTDKRLFEILEEWCQTINEPILDFDKKLESIGVNPIDVYFVNKMEIFGLLDDYQNNVNNFLKSGENLMKNLYPKENYNTILKDYIENKNSSIFTSDYNFRDGIERLTDKQLLRYINSVGGN